MTTQFSTNQQKQEITQKLKLQFGISLPKESLLIETGKERIRLFSGNLTKEQIQKIEEIAQIETIGSYLCKKDKEDLLRLSLDAAMILKNKITKNIIQLNDNEAQEWLKGNNIQKQAQKGILAVMHNNDFLGCAKSTGISLLNHIPKDRRVR